MYADSGPYKPLPAGPSSVDALARELANILPSLPSEKPIEELSDDELKVVLRNVISKDWTLNSAYEGLVAQRTRDARLRARLLIFVVLIASLAAFALLDVREIFLFEEFLAHFPIVGLLLNAVVLSALMTIVVWGVLRPAIQLVHARTAPEARQPSAPFSSGRHPPSSSRPWAIEFAAIERDYALETARMLHVEHPELGEIRYRLHYLEHKLKELALEWERAGRGEGADLVFRELALVTRMANYVDTLKALSETEARSLARELEHVTNILAKLSRQR